MRIRARLLTGSAAFRNRSFRWLSAGAGLNSAGMQGEQVVLGYMIYRLTESSMWVGLSLALFFAPMLLVGVPAGALADRFDRRTVLIVIEGLLLLSLAIFGGLLMLGMIGVTGVLVMSVLSGTLRAIHHPARLSFAGDMAGDTGLVAALSLLGITSRFGQLFGAVFAGGISEVYGAGAAYVVLALGHAAALWMFVQTDRRQPVTGAGQSELPAGVWSGIVEYLILMKSHTVILTIVVLASLVEIFGFSFATAMPEIAIERLGVNDSGLGAMHAMRAAGGLTGALLLSLFATKQIGSLFLLVVAGFGGALVLLAIAPHLSWVLLAVGVVALFASWTDILVQSLLQISAPAEVRGRAMGAWVFALGMGPIGHIELGFLMNTFGTTVALVFNGIMLVIIGVVAVLILPGIKQVRTQ